jgi:hypothetical protein
MSLHAPQCKLFGHSAECLLGTQQAPSTLPRPRPQAALAAKDAEALGMRAQLSVRDALEGALEKGLKQLKQQVGAELSCTPLALPLIQRVTACDTSQLHTRPCC